jgi:hypothetical protein
MKKKISWSGGLTVVALLLACWYVMWLTQYSTNHPRYPFTLWPPRYTGPPRVSAVDTNIFMLMTNELNGHPNVYPAYTTTNRTGFTNLFKNHPVWASSH